MSGVIDGFGEAYMAYLRGEPSNHTTERDDGYVHEIPDASYYFRTYNEWPKNEQDAIQEAKGRVLDIGLGAGRHALYLQEKGYSVVGIDNSPLSIEVSKLRGVKDARLMSVFNLDFPDNSFDTVLMLGGNLGIGSVDMIRSYLTKLYDITSSDGIIIGESRNPLETDNSMHLAYHERNRHEGVPAGFVRLRIGFQGRFGDWFELLWMEEELLEKVIAPTGWRVSKYYHSENGPYIAILAK